MTSPINSKLLNVPFWFWKFVDLEKLLRLKDIFLAN